MTQHIVQKGDTLWKISKQHGVPLNELIAANPQISNPDKIDVGMTMMIPTGGGNAPAAPAPIEAPVTPYPATMPAAPAPEPVGMTGGHGEAPAAPAAETPAAQTPVAETPSPAPTPAPSPAPSPSPFPAYPSVPKWEGLWKYVVKNGDTMFKIAKQVGVTLEHLKAANPQIPEADKIYPGQVLNIPSSGMKTKGNPGLSAKEQLTSPMSKEQLTAPMSKEQLTAPIAQQPVAPQPIMAPIAPQPIAAPIGMQPINKEQLTSPKEMVPVEKPITAPMYHPAPPHISPLEINANLQYAPHKEYINYHPTQVQQVQQAPLIMPQQHQQHEQPHYLHEVHHVPMMMYLPVSMKHKHKCQKHHKKCHPKKRCGHKKFQHSVYQQDLHAHLMHLQMQQHMGLGTYPKTFYRED